MKAHQDIRPSSIAGQWYPGDSTRLASSVDGYIAAAQPPAVPGKLQAIIVPHAGHRYSGPVAGWAYTLVRDMPPEQRPDLVAVVSPMHYPVRYPFLTTAHTAYETPLGLVPVDADSLAAVDAALQASLGFGLAPVKHDPEHSLEIELPFLQRALPEGFSLLPVMVHTAGAEAVQALGAALAGALAGRKALLVASSDLSHFYTQAVAETLDREALRRIEALDPQAVMDMEAEGKGFACGRGALAAVLWAAQELGANHAQVVRYATSGDVTGDYRQVVGYGAAVVTRI
jgi:AmmeMemoRadiSam system protein B